MTVDINDTAGAVDQGQAITVDGPYEVITPDGNVNLEKLVILLARNQSPKLVFRQGYKQWELYITGFFQSTLRQEWQPGDAFISGYTEPGQRGHHFDVALIDGQPFWITTHH